MTRNLIALLALGTLAGCAAYGPDTYNGTQHERAERQPEHQITIDRSHGPDRQVLFPVEDIPWRAGPGSLPEGCQYAVLEGDPSKPGLFTMQLKLPDGYRIPPHTHPNVERVTVLKGTFNLGHGSTFQRDATKALNAGSYTAMPPGMQHFAWAKGETVVQLTSIGPWEINYINPDDDPRR
jgi:quercetin dioxygenase-like cupin family protein